ncbi:hypothetical protein VKT23_019854 [Stygiomarasmius scandens]|uniref:F-box domain-containing protein n=1 Tax=Marasmiellus scandens TaxID=2682957 RepID=A0ABR1IN39_9AGAR
MHQALKISEILQEIFQNMEKSTQKRCTVVCRDWSETALDVVWFEVTDLKSFFRALGGLQETNINNQILLTFTPTPRHSDWDRFETRYCDRIHVLSVTEDYRYSRVFDVLARIRPSRPLLRNLHTLRWNGLGGLGMTEAAIMFMHERITTCRITALGNYSEGNIAFLETMRARMPNLTKLALELAARSEYVMPVATLVKGLSKITTLAIPPFPESSSIIAALSGLNNLERLDIGSGSIEEVITHYNPIEKKSGYFSSLTTLCLFCSYQTATNFFRNELPVLSEVQIFTIHHEQPSIVQSLLTDMSKSCPFIRDISLLIKKGVFRPGSAPSVLDSLSIHHIRPVLSNASITTFRISHPSPMNLLQTDIDEITRAWPNIRHVSLCPDPLHYIDSTPNVSLSGPSLGLVALLPFAKNCPNIESIGLFVDATKHLGNNQLASQVFHKLHTLRVGVSPIETEKSVTAFLCHLIKPECHVIYGSDWYTHESSSKSVDEQRWNVVDELLPLLMSVRIITVQTVMDQVRDKDASTASAPGKKVV